MRLDMFLAFGLGGLLSSTAAANAQVFPQVDGVTVVDQEAVTSPAEITLSVPATGEAEAVTDAGSVLSLQPLTEDELSGLRGGQTIVVGNQTLEAVNANNSLGNYEAGDVTISGGALSSFNGVGNIAINTGAQVTLQSAMNVTINVGGN